MGKLPRYKAVYEDIRRKIVDQVFKQNDQIPSENELCAEYGTTRPTIRKALDQLANDAFIQKHRGRKSIVSSSRQSIGILSVAGTTSGVGKDKITTRLIIKPEKRMLQSAFSFPLSDYEKQFDCIYFERQRLIEGEPILFDITIIPNINMNDFFAHDMEQGSLFDTLRMNYGIEILSGTQEFFAIQADKRLMEVLNLKYKSPVLQCNRKMKTSRCDFYIYSQVFCSTAMYGLISTF